jgi:hypothetical protein
MLWPRPGLVAGTVSDVDWRGSPNPCLPPIVHMHAWRPLGHALLHIRQQSQTAHAESHADDPGMVSGKTPVTLKYCYFLLVQQCTSNDLTTGAERLKG